MQEPHGSLNTFSNAAPARRFGLFDLIRGLSLLSMMGYHATWNFVYLFGFKLSWYRGLPGAVWQLSICCTFILLSGFCWSFGRKRWRRGLTVLLGGALVSVATLVAMPDQAVRFGILTLLGSAMLLQIPLEKLDRLVPPMTGLIVCLILFFLFRDMSEGSLGFGSISLVSLPKALYANDLTAYLGFPPASFWSTDYFPLLPWLPLFMAGHQLQRLCAGRTEWPEPHFPGSRALCFLGRHSLPVYLLHQPIIFAFMLYFALILFPSV